MTTAVEKLRLTYPGSGTLLFKDVSVEIKKGEKVYPWSKAEVENQPCFKY